MEVRAQEIATLTAPAATSAEEMARRQLQQDTRRYPGMQNRPESWLTEAQGPRSEARFVAEYPVAGQPHVECVACVMDDRLAVRFTARGPEAQQQEIMAAVEELLRSYKAL
jgi:hypothetical protein